MQQARLPYPASVPGICSNSSALSQQRYSTFSPSVTAFSFCFQSFSASGSCQWVGSADKETKVLRLQPQASVLPMNIQDWFPYGWLVSASWVQRTLKSLLKKKKERKEKKPSPSPQFELSIVWRSASFIVQLSHPYVTTRKTIGLTILTFVSKVISCFWIRCLDWSSLFFQGVTVFKFHGWNHHPQWFWSPPKVCHWFRFPHLLELSNGAKCHDLSFLNVEFSASFHSRFHPH